MVQFRRLDPLANASPWQRHVKRAIKTFTLTEAQYARIEEKRREFIIMEYDRVVVGQPLRDFLVMHYAYPEIGEFSEHFKRMFDLCTFVSNKTEAPRGVILSFRDRPNRSRAEVIFWECALTEGGEWVEMDNLSVPEQEDPGDHIEGGFQGRDAGAADRETIAKLEAEVMGMPPLSEGGVDSLYENSDWLKLVTTSSGVPVGCVVLRREPGGWGIIDHVFLLQAVRDQLLEPVTRWTIAFLRNNGGRRQRRRVYMDQNEDVALMRSLEFTAGESGVDFMRPVEAAEVEQQIEERKQHGTIIKFGNWR